MKTTTRKTTRRARFDHNDSFALELAAMSIEELPKWLAAYRSKAIPSRMDLERVAIIEAELAARDERAAKLVTA